MKSGVAHADRMSYELHPVDPLRLPDQPNRQLASNTFDVSANPELAGVLLAFRF
ncbi:hypothetical protein [Burkholderia catarinensis]|uniref:hypothetical protein n=1 Tax=Burkholderia catarinensis TaxID=1108140 RepID=UPI000A3F5BB8|nr:hypothetical protein [Burkholderia catarinensis]